MSSAPLSGADILAVCRVLNTTADLIVEDTSRGLPEVSKELISMGLKGCAQKLAGCDSLDKTILQFHHDVAFQEAAQELLRTHPDLEEAKTIMEGLQPGYIAKGGEGEDLFMNFVSEVLEPKFYTDITEKIFDRVAQSRPSPGQQL